MRNLNRKQLQQVVVLGVLFLAAVGYAVYQLFFAAPTGASTKGSATTTASSENAEADASSPQTTTPPWLSTSTPARDPFVIPPQFDNLRQSQRQSASPSPSRIASAPAISALPPMPVAPPSTSTAGTSPPLAGGAPLAAPSSEPELSVTVTGIVVGEYPVAILRAGEGNQRIVQPGNQLEGGYILRTVSREGVVLEKDGKTVILRPGGNPNAK
ncbi:MAG: hypothetical protein RMK92_01925 [Armatimonadota bacterium]|nr:hypothetical protein [Armatimonadota bacterium]